MNHHLILGAGRMTDSATYSTRLLSIDYIIMLAVHTSQEAHAKIHKAEIRDSRLMSNLEMYKEKKGRSGVGPYLASSR